MSRAIWQGSAYPGRAERELLKGSMLAGLPEQLAKAVSPYGGMVRSLMNISPEPGDPGLYLSLAVPGNPKHFVPGQVGLIDYFASGMGFTLEEANLSAVAEAVERYCAAYVIPDRTIFTTWNELQAEALHPDELPLFTEEQHAQWQFPYHKFEADTPIRWVEGVSLTTGKRKWVPAAIAWDSYVPVTPDEEAICFGLMTGSAAGSTKEQAMIGGLLEIIERDAFMVMWYNMISMPLIDFRNHPVAEPFQELLDESRFELAIVDTTSDLGIPSSFGLMRTRDGRVSFGGSARLSMEEAVRKTLMEVSQLYIGNKAQIYSKHVPSLLPQQVTDYGIRLPYYQQPYAYEELAFTVASQELRPLSTDNSLVQGSEAERLNTIVRALENRGLEVICVDVTTPDVKELGLTVVKMIVPGTVQLPRSEKERVISSKRIYEVPSLLGYTNTPQTSDDLNVSPHPFP